MIRYVLLLMLCLPLAAVGSISFAAAGDGRPCLLLISIDGFRWDYLDRYPTPALTRLAARGVRADGLRPVYPTLTFPNHYSIATGQYPVEHGIVANDFPDGQRTHWYSYKNPATVQDGDWYGGEPIWVALERAGGTSAAFFFVGTEAAVAGVSPTHWRAFDASVPGTARIEQALAWLQLPPATRPQLITLYFEQVDEVSHHYGPGSPESVAAIKKVDGWLGQLQAGIDRLPHRDDVYVVVVSDHGQGAYRRDAAPLVLDDVVDLRGVSISESGPFALLYLPPDDRERALEIRDAINATWRHGRAYRPGDAPARWRLDGSARVADVIVQADAGYGVVSTRDNLRFMTAGDHGWAPEGRDMHGIFVAAGAGIAPGSEVGEIDAVEVYPLLLEILGLVDRRAQRHPSRLAGLLDRESR